MWELFLGWVIVCIVILTIWNFFCVRESNVINWWIKRRKKRIKQQQEKAKQLENKKISDHMIKRWGPSYADARYFAVDLERGQQQIQSRHENAKGKSAFSARENMRIHLLSQRINERERQQNRMQTQQQQNAPFEPTGQQHRRQFPPSPHIFWPSQSQPTLSTLTSISAQQNAGANDGLVEEMQPNWPNEQDGEGGSIHFQSARSSPLPPSLSSVPAWSSQSQQSTSNEKCADDVPMESSLPPVPAWSSQSQQSTSNEKFAGDVPIENQWESGDTWGQPATGNEVLCTQCSAKIKNDEEEKIKKEEEKEPNERDEYSFESNVHKIGPLSQKILKNIDCHFARFPEDRHKICPICRDFFGIAQPVTHSDCGFLFHYNCISRWFDVCRICPICRNIVGRKDTHKKEAKAKKNDNDAW